MKKTLTIVALLFAFCAANLAFFSCSVSSDAPAIIPYSDNRASSDWLFLVYLDGDDTAINDAMYFTMRESEMALAQIRNPDGTPKEGRPSINIVVLWDGISEELKGKSKYLHPDGAVYELGADYEVNINAFNDTEFKLCANTKDLTQSARGWLAKEPDMGDAKTLEGFLKWCKSRYKSDNVVIALNDHGAGTHKETYSDITAVSKSLCSDATNKAKAGKTKLLTCKGIKDALSAAGWTGADKPKILWNDLCLQASAEILYNYAGCAEYFCASPNVSVINDRYDIILSVKKDSTALDVGKMIVSAYYNMYCQEGANYHQKESSAKALRASGYSMFTCSLFSLGQKKTAALKTAVDNFADALLAIKASGNDLFNSIYTKYIKQDMDDLSKCKGLAYAGTFAYLNDLGWLAKEVLADNALAAAHPAAQALLDLLKHGDDNLIVYAWGGNRASGETTSETTEGSWTDVTTNSMYLTGQKDFISGNPVAVEHSDDVYGLTIVGSPRYGYPEGSTAPKPYGGESNTVVNYYDWTEFSQSWGTVINNWMNWAYNLP